MSNRASAHLRSASAYFASTHAIQGCSGVSLSVIDIRPVVIVEWDQREPSRRTRASLRKRRRVKRSAIPRVSEAPRPRRGVRHSRISYIQKALIRALPPTVTHRFQVPFCDVESACQHFHLLDSVGLFVWALLSPTALAARLSRSETSARISSRSVTAPSVVSKSPYAAYPSGSQ
jgi:hypothetical protein